MIKVLGLFLVVLVGLFFVIDFVARSEKTVNVQEVTFEIRGVESAQGRDNVISLGERLEEEGVISSRYVFYYYMLRHGLASSFLAGDYVVAPKTPYSMLGIQFAEGDVEIVEREEVRITFAEGLRIDQMVPVVEDAGFSGEKFMEIADNPPQSLYDQFSFLPEGLSLEGYLYPETYDFFVTADEIDIVTRMLEEFDKQINDDVRAQAIKDDRTLHEVITMASIVEGEVYKSSERPTVAGIFWKRLEIGMPLGSDETIDYINRLSKVKHTLEDIAVESPYNTYKNAGLPPGPVNSPSLDAIMATINAEETEFLFFLNNAIEGSPDEGKTVFSKTYEEHLLNKAKNGL